MNEELIADARTKAGNYFREGYNCAEAIFLTFREYIAPDLNRDMVRLVTPLGGGLGHAGCTCGSLSGGVIIIGAVKGRTSPADSRGDSYDLAAEYHKRFREEFGTTCCRALNRYEEKDPERKKLCLKIIGNSAGVLMRMLQEKGVV